MKFRAIDFGGIRAIWVVSIVCLLLVTSTLSSAQLLSGLTVSRSTLLGGQKSTGTVTLSQAAPAGGATIALSSSLQSYCSVPGSLSIGEGKTSGTFSISTVAHSRNLMFTIGATAANKKTATLTTLCDTVSGVSLSPATVVRGGTSIGTVTLFNPAPQGGWQVNLASSLPDYCTLPASVTVPEGANSSTFSLSTIAHSRSLTSTITASDAGSSHRWCRARPRRGIRCKHVDDAPCV